MLKRSASESVEEEEIPLKRVAIENRDSSPFSVASGFDANESDRINRDFPDDDVSPVNVSNGEPDTGPSAKPVIVSSHKLKPKLTDYKTPSDSPENYIHLRILVNSREAVEIIGRRGVMIGKIKEAAGVRLKVTDNYAGAVERMVHIKGATENVAKAAGLLVRVIRSDPFDQPSTGDSDPYNMRLVFPHAIMGPLIGKGGSKFREIEDASSAKLKAQENKLSMSDDRILSVYGVADAVHIAVYYLCSTYNAHKETAIKPNHSYVAYDPMIAAQNGVHAAGNGYFQGNIQKPPGDPHSSHPTNSGTNRRAQLRDTVVPPPKITRDLVLQQAQRQAENAPPGEELVQDIVVPNRYVGSIIGKGGAKIKEIRKVSGSQVKVAEPNGESENRTVTVKGFPDGNQLAIYLIYQKIENDRRIEARDTDN